MVIRDTFTRPRFKREQTLVVAGMLFLWRCQVLCNPNAKTKTLQLHTDRQGHIGYLMDTNESTSTAQRVTKLVRRPIPPRCEASLW